LIISGASLEPPAEVGPLGALLIGVGENAAIVAKTVSGR
jgi:hypothetical protein